LWRLEVDARQDRAQAIARGRHERRMKRTSHRYRPPLDAVRGQPFERSVDASPGAGNHCLTRRIDVCDPNIRDGCEHFAHSDRTFGYSGHRAGIVLGRGNDAAATGLGKLVEFLFTEGTRTTQGNVFTVAVTGEEAGR